MTVNLLEYKTSRKRSEQRDWIDSFEVASEDVLREFDPETHGPSDGAALIGPDAFEFESVDDLKVKLQSAINGCTQADPDRKYRIIPYNSESLIIVRKA